MTLMRRPSQESKNEEDPQVILDKDDSKLHTDNGFGMSQASPNMTDWYRDQPLDLKVSEVGLNASALPMSMTRNNTANATSFKLQPRGQDSGELTPVSSATSSDNSADTDDHGKKKKKVHHAKTLNVRDRNNSLFSQKGKRKRSHGLSGTTLS